MCNPNYCMQQATIQLDLCPVCGKPKHPFYNYCVDCFKKNKALKQKENLNNCFDYQPKHLTEKERLTEKEFRKRKKVFWATHLIDIFPVYQSYHTFVGKEKLRWCDEEGIRQAKKKALATKKNYGFFVGKK